MLRYQSSKLLELVGEGSPGYNEGVRKKALFQLHITIKQWFKLRKLENSVVFGFGFYMQFSLRGNAKCRKGNTAVRGKYLCEI
jgi:hypothetical protein